MSQVARHVRVTGRVQGVFFRAWTAEQARVLGVAGWVRNCADGCVEAHLEGGESALNQMLELMRQGPPSARVSLVTAEPAELEEADRFEVRH